MARDGQFILLKDFLDIPEGYKKHHAVLQADLPLSTSVDNECMIQFSELKGSSILRYIVYKIEVDLNRVIVETVGSHNNGLEDLAAVLPADECRYVLYDYEFSDEYDFDFYVPSGLQSRIFFIDWVPASASASNIAVYSCIKDTFKRQIYGVQSEVMAVDLKDVNSMMTELCKRRNMALDP